MGGYDAQEHQAVLNRRHVEEGSCAEAGTENDCVSRGWPSVIEEQQARKAGDQKVDEVVVIDVADFGVRDVDEGQTHDQATDCRGRQGEISAEEEDD